MPKDVPDHLIKIWQEGYEVASTPERRSEFDEKIAAVTALPRANEFTPMEHLLMDERGLGPAALYAFLSGFFYYDIDVKDHGLSVC